MQFLMAKFFQSKALQSKFLMGAVLTSALFSPFLSASTHQLQSYQAEYDILRQGERHGSAFRRLTVTNDSCELSYKSDIKWMIFNDKRSEQATFDCANGEIKPLQYVMEREGTGPDRKYTLNFDHQTKQVTSNASKYPLDINWENGLQDLISYQAQMRLDLLAGKKEFDYPIVDKKGKARHYRFEILGTETITLPFGNVETIKARRVYNNDKRQALAWFAPSMDYLLVRMWKGEKGVEQFDVQLKSYEVKK
ncbi:DUF3108 domain-containing protein [Pseudoalteromonas sp. SSM20]|uniref:DUF3108 domain-containing protein n=1 Tax=Pseudoalteromonas sp. SSM20 TaxID=3139394 RepID=UPI003BAAEB42